MYLPVAEVEVGGDLLGLQRREGAGADSVTPAAVTNSGTDKVHLSTHRILVDDIDQHRDVDAGVGLTGDVKLVALILRELSEEVGQELIGILSSGFVSIHTVRFGLGTFAV